jgi:hypothetical protein
MEKYLPGTWSDFLGQPILFEDASGTAEKIHDTHLGTIPRRVRGAAQRGLKRLGQLAERERFFGEAIRALYRFWAIPRFQIVAGLGRIHLRRGIENLSLEMSKEE